MAQAVSHCASSLRWICGERNDNGIGFALSESFRQCSPLVYHRRYPHVILGDYGEWIIRSEFNAQTKSCLHCPDTLRRTVHFNMVAAEAVRLAACVACDYLVYIKVTEKKRANEKHLSTCTTSYMHSQSCEKRLLASSWVRHHSVYKPTRCTELCD